MINNKTYNLFISHGWDRDEEYIRLVNNLNQYSNFQWRNYSVSIANPLSGGTQRKLSVEIDRQLRLASAVLIISGIYVTYREWINFEIDLADKYDKPIIGIIPRGNIYIPNAVKEFAWEIVRWYTPSIIKAIMRTTDQLS